MLYMAVTADKYELPCVVKDTANQLATAYGISDSNLHQGIQEVWCEVCESGDWR